MTFDELNAKTKKARGYGLGERNPKTMPGMYGDSETREANHTNTRRWIQLRKLAEAGRL